MASNATKGWNRMAWRKRRGKWRRLSRAVLRDLRNLRDEQLSKAAVN